MASTEKRPRNLSYQSAREVERNAINAFVSGARRPCDSGIMKPDTIFIEIF